MPTRLKTLTVEGYRSVDDEQRLVFQAGRPLAIVGNNNAGKSNLVGALDRVLGERWPASWQPESSDFFVHSDGGTSRYLRIEATVAGWPAKYGGTVEAVLRLTHKDGKTDFTMIDGDTGEKLYTTNEQRLESLRSILVGAQTDLAYQLSYRSQYTWLSRLMHRFHESVRRSPERLAELEDAFNRVRESFDNVPELSKFRDELSSQLMALSGSFGYSMDTDFSSYDPRNFFHALRLEARAGDIVRSLGELGTGQQQILCIALAYAYAQAFRGGSEGLVLIVEEPEAHLSPASQEWLAEYLSQHALAGLQVVITTHNPHFLSFSNLGSVARITKDGPLEPSMITQPSVRKVVETLHNLGATRASEDGTANFYEGTSTLSIKNAFFCEVAILVEGETEEHALPVIIKRLDRSLYQRGVRVVRCNGKNDIPKWIRLLKAFNIPTYVIFDSDGVGAQAKEHVDMFSALEVPMAQWEDFLGRDGISVCDGFAVMGTDYESAMAHEFGDFTALYDSAGAALGGSVSKSIRARWVAENLKLHDDAGRCLSPAVARLIGALRERLPVPARVPAKTAPPEERVELPEDSGAGIRF